MRNSNHNSIDADQEARNNAFGYMNVCGPTKWTHIPLLYQNERQHKMNFVISECNEVQVSIHKFQQKLSNN